MKISLRVQPNAPRNELLGVTGDVLRVRIAAPPVQGKANKELVSFLSQALGVSKDSVSITAGHTSRNKVIAIEGLSQEEFSARISRWLSASSGGTTSTGYHR